MILQRKKIQEDIDVVVEACVDNIRKKGVIDIPSIMIEMLQAQKEYEKEQLEVILRAYEQSVRDFGTDMARVPIDMTKIILDNKVTLEGLGFYFESRNQEGMCWMKKSYGERGS